MTKKFLTLLAAAASATLLAGVLGAAAPASAGTPQSCWEEVDTGRSLCASSDQALADAVYTTYGIHLAPRPSEPVSKAMKQPSAKAQAARAAAMKKTDGSSAVAAVAAQTYLLVKIFDGQNYTGSSKSYTVSLSEAPCRVAQSYTYGQYKVLNPIPQANWNDRIRSFQVVSPCRLELYRDDVFRGSKFGPARDTGNLGIMDGEASSMRIVA